MVPWKNKEVQTYFVRFWAEDKVQRELDAATKQCREKLKINKKLPKHQGPQQQEWNKWKKCLFVCLFVQPHGRDFPPIDHREAAETKERGDWFQLNKYGRGFYM